VSERNIILTDTNNDQAFGPYQSEYDAACDAVDMMLEFEEITKAERDDMRKELDQNAGWGDVIEEFGWSIWTLQPPSESYR
jgi:hypothetical protein